MISGAKNKRPSCDEILKKIDSWALNLEKIRDEKVFQSLLNLKDSPIDFHKTFLLEKCRFSINSVNVCAISKDLFDGSLELDCKNSDLNSSKFWTSIIPSEDSISSDIDSTENILKTQIRLEEEIGAKVKANKTEYNLGSAVNRFNSQSNETLSIYKSEFEELELIGGGGFVEVYKVINCLDRQKYAVKKILLKGIYKSNFHHL